jgi:hypothetical protein
MVCSQTKDPNLGGELLWLSGKVVKNEKINEIERTRVHSRPRVTSFFKIQIWVNFGVP